MDSGINLICTCASFFRKNTQLFGLFVIFYFLRQITRYCILGTNIEMQRNPSSYNYFSPATDGAITRQPSLLLLYQRIVSITEKRILETHGYERL